MHQPLHRSVGQRHTERTASGGEYQALDDLRADELRPTATESGADGRLTAARGGTRYQQVRNVETCDQQKAARCGQQRIEAALHMAHLPIQDGPQIYGIIHWSVRILETNLPLDRAEVCGRLRHGDARLQLADHVEVVRRVDLHDLVRPLVIERRPQLRASIRVTEPCREHAHNRIGLCVHQDGTAQQRRVTSIAALPQSPAQNDRGVRSRTVIIGCEKTPDRGMNAEHGQRVPGGRFCVNYLRHLRGSARQVVSGLLHDAHLDKAARLSLPAREASAGDDVVLKFVAPCLIDTHQAIGMSDGQRFEKHSVDDSKQRDVRADTQREDQDRCQARRRARASAGACPGEYRARAIPAIASSTFRVRVRARRPDCRRGAAPPDAPRSRSCLLRDFPRSADRDGSAALASSSASADLRPKRV